MKKIIFFCLVFLSTRYFVLGTVFAQNAIDLAISPPILEVIIQPGKEVSSTFTVTNAGGDTILTPKVVKFVPSDERGNVTLTNIPAPDWVKYDKTPINFGNGDTLDFIVLISPPQDLEEIDHYISFVFESSEAVDLLNNNTSFYKAKIASNILLTISKDGKPKKSAEVLEFSAPKLADSFLSPITYNLTLANNGNFFWKPEGKIIVNGEEILNLAPQNIISGSSRQIFCIKDENLIPCTYNKKPLFGKISAKLEFHLDENSKLYSKNISTFAFPFSLVAIIAIILGVLLTKKHKKSHSKSKL